MINREELIEYSKLKGLNLGNTEKDYLLDIALLIISKSIKNELIFKGGTALYKFYNLDRFSEDLDFTLNSELNFDIFLNDVVSGLKKFNLNSEIFSKKDTKKSFTCQIRIERPLYTGIPMSYAKIEIDINKDSKLQKEPDMKKYISIYSNVPSFGMQLMNIDEIFSEKIRALLTRQKARDLYDVWFLINRNIKLDMGLINKKLGYYDKKLSKKELMINIESKKKLWDLEMKRLILDVPDYNLVKKETINFFPNI